METGEDPFLLSLTRGQGHPVRLRSRMYIDTDCDDDKRTRYHKL